VEHGYGKESSFSYKRASAEQELDESSNIHSSSTPVDHGYGKESSYSYLPAYNRIPHHLIQSTKK
jgi:hypothetical protein